MKRLITSCLVITSVFSAIAEDWTQLSDIPGTGRFWSAGFTINGKIYAGTGRTGFSGNATQDMWEYDPIADSWSQIADYPAGIREGAEGFGDGTRGFLGFGTSFIQFSNEVYEYLPESNTWEAKASCPGSFAYSHGFTISGKYYIGPENGNNKMHAYDIESNSWSEVAPFPGQDRRAQVAFTSQGKGYIGLGAFVFGGSLSDFFAYDPIADTWQQIASLSPASDQSCATSINDIGYVFNVGQNGKRVFKYTESTDSWEQVSTHPGDRIANSTFIGLNGSGYLVFGERTISGGNITSQQTWRFIPSTVSLNKASDNSIQFISSSNRALVFNSETAQKCRIKVWTINGQLQCNEDKYFQEGLNTIPINYSGLIIYQITGRNNELQVGKCVLM